jgi:subtilisin-like proprotein convertase family protein
MRKLYTIACFLLTASFSQAQSIFYEAFESGVPGQFTQEYIFGTTDWLGSTAGMTLGGSDPVFEGDSSAHMYGTNTENRTALITPSLDMSASGYKLGFAHTQGDWVGDQNTLAIHYSGDDGATWTLIDSIVDDVPNYLEVEYNLDNYVTTTATSKIRFTGYVTWGYAIGLDVVNVFLPATDDAELTDAIAPANGCGLGSEIVTLEVFNNGLDTIFSLDASYEINASVESETFAVEIPAGGTDTLYFSVPVDMSAIGSYNFTAWTDLAGDLDLNNDTITFSATNIPVIATLPYTEGFESGAGGWVSGGTNSTWELGDANNTLIDTANSGVNAWVTNLTGDYAVSELSYVESPCLDFSALSIDPVFRFAHIFDTENCCDEGYVDISFDAGTTWARLGAAGEGENWYDDAFNNEWDGTGTTSGGTEWRTAEHLLDGAAGESSVKLRIGFSADFSGQNEGFGFDDINIFEQPAINAGVIEILSPLSGCGLGTELVTVVIENTGDDFLVDFNVEYNIGAGVVTQLVTDTLFSSEVDTITFTVPADLSTLGTYNLGAWTAVVGDGDLGNDSLFSTVSNVPVISALPYTEGFESGAGGWNTGGVSSSWELGDPQGAFIDTANSGINAWVTNLSGQYPISELSYIESPCFDFSSLSIDPIFEFAQIFNTEDCCDEGYVDLSTDAGATWTRLGIAGEGTNWYNDAFNNEWDGESGDSTDWRIASHLLDGTAGESSVKIRIGFSSDGSINAEGFGVDDISLTEQPAINSEATAIVSPVNGCGLTATESIQVQVSNLGSEVMDSVIIGFSVDNGSAVTEVFNNSIAIGGDTTFTLTQTIDLSAFGNYEITVWTATVGDGDTANDTATVIVTSVPTISSLPYTQDFETGTNGWTSGGVNSTWEFGDPETVFIDTANSGVNAWVTNLDGNYVNNEDSYVESPCLDFSAYSADPVLRFAGIFRTEACCDEGWVDISLDGGTTWTKLGAAGEGTNWYNDAADNFWNGTSGLANDWLTAEHILDGVAGLSDVKIRFMFSSDGSAVDAGFGLDDISIFEQPQLDLDMISFNAPGDGCALGEEAVTFTFWNKGLADVTGFDYGFSVNGGAAQIESSPASLGLIASGDTVTITFTTELADLSAVGVYSIDVFTALAGDEDTSNDTLFAVTVENFGASTPLSQTEEPELAISSNFVNGSTSQIFFCGLPTSLDGCLEIDNVTIDSIQHTWLSDLDIYLISPAGDTIELSTDNGGAGDDMVNVVFSDTSTNDITLQTSGILPGVYQTEDTLGFAGLYNGQDPNGAWSLYIDDDTGGDDGVLVSWSMTFVDNSPMPVLTYSDTIICLTQVLTVTAEPYDSWLWSTGNNGQSADLFGNVLGLGTHEIFVTVDQDGCTGESNSFTLTVDACAGIAELGALSIDIYPNPSNGQIVVDITGETEGLNVSILDINGKLIQSEQIGKVTTGVRKAIDLRNVSKGMYFIKLDDGKDAVTQKLVIQ